MHGRGVGDGLRVGACQTPEILGDLDAAVACIVDFAGQAADHDVDLLLFPECFLQGYLVEEAHVRRHALDLRSGRLARVLRSLAPVPQTLVFGIVEQQDGRYFNTQFAEAAAAVADQGARLLLVPAQNMMRRRAATRWKDQHHRIRAARARETGMWLVSADVTGARDAHRVGYGPTSVIDPQGEVVAHVPLLTTGMVIQHVAY